MKNRKSMTLTESTIDAMEKTRLICDCSRSEAIDVLCNIAVGKGFDFIKRYYDDVFKPNRKDGRKKNGRPKNTVEDNTVPSIPSPMS